MGSDQVLGLDRAAWRAWYKGSRWARLRKAQLTKVPCCYLCAREGLVEAATIVHHIRAHRGDPILFFDPTNLASVCKPHHDRELQSEEQGGVGWVERDRNGWQIYRPQQARR